MGVLKDQKLLLKHLILASEVVSHGFVVHVIMLSLLESVFELSSELLNGFVEVFVFSTNVLKILLEFSSFSIHSLKAAVFVH